MPLVLIGFVAACVQGDFVQAGGTYATRCSATMEARGELFLARCKPAACEEGFFQGPINHVVTGIDPGKKVVGYAERVCIADPAKLLGGAEPEPDAEPEPEPEPETDP